MLGEMMPCMAKMLGAYPVVKRGYRDVDPIVLTVHNKESYLEHVVTFMEGISQLWRLMEHIKACVCVHRKYKVVNRLHTRYWGAFSCEFERWYLSDCVASQLLLQSSVDNSMICNILLSCHVLQVYTLNYIRMCSVYMFEVYLNGQLILEYKFIIFNYIWWL